MIVKEKNILNHTALGVFLLLWSTSAFVLAGEIARYCSLFLGLFFLITIFFKRKLLKQEIRFFVICLLFTLAYLAIAVIQNQDTLDILNLSFILIDLILICVGYSLGLMSNLNLKISKKIIYIITFLAIIGPLKLIQYQATSFAQGFTDRVDDNLLNPIGIAYLNSLLILILFWLFKNTDKKTLKYLIILAVILTFIVLISTLSRGAMISLVIIFVLYNFRGYRLKLLFINSFKSIIFIFLLCFVIYYISQEIPVIKYRIDGFVDRFSSLFNSVESTNDISVSNRQDIYTYFFNNLNDFILFGQYKYSPYPHNQFLEIIMRWGVLGFPLLFYSITNLFRSLKLFKKKVIHQNKLLFLILPLFIFAYFQSMTSLSLEMNRILWLGFGFLSSFVTIKNKASIKLK
jgi:hypothetical protein